MKCCVVHPRIGANSTPTAVSITGGLRNSGSKPEAGVRSGSATETESTAADESSAGACQEAASAVELLRRRFHSRRLDEREGGMLLHRTARLGGDRDEVVLVERVHLVAAAHRKRVGALEGLA